MKTYQKILIGIIIAIPALVLLKSCMGIFYIKMTHLSKEDLEWVKPAQRYRSAHFESNRGRSAYLVITNRYVHNDTNPFYISSAGDTYEANAGYEYKITCDSVEIEGDFVVSRLIQNDKLGYRATLYLFCTDFSYLVLRSGTVVIRGKEIQNCIVVNNNNAKYSKYWINEVKNKINEFIISKEYGLIYYRFEDGEQFFRVFPDDELKPSTSN